MFPTCNKDETSLDQSDNLEYNSVHYVLLYGKHGHRKRCELYYYEGHVWDRLEDKCPDMSDLELENIEQTGSTCLKHGSIHMVEVVECNCHKPELHIACQSETLPS